jgi:hypothetical protein
MRHDEERKKMKQYEEKYLEEDEESIAIGSIQWKKKQMDWEKIEKTNCVSRVFYNMISPFFFVFSYKLITIINNNCFIKKKLFNLNFSFF